MKEDGFLHIVERLRNHEPALFTTSVWDEELDSNIAELSAESLDAGKGETEHSFVLAVKAGLYVWNESLARSHELSQQLHHASGSYWHGIMHRMEGDYPNAKYWFEQVGNHPVFERLQSAKASALKPQEIDQIRTSELRLCLQQLALQGAWDPYLFVYAVQAAVTSGRETKAERMLRALQKQEIIFLLEHSYRNACGGNFLESID